MRNIEHAPGDRHGALSVPMVADRLVESSPRVRINRLAGSGKTCLHELEPGTKILVGGVGDHSRVLSLLDECIQAPLEEDFQSRLDEPSYQPSDRLLLERHGQLVGHVHVSRPIAWFDRQRCSVSRFRDFLVLPEFLPTEIDAAMLQAAEGLARAEGSLLGLVQTDRKQWFEQQGWSCHRGQGYTLANTRTLLAHLNAQNAQRRPPAKPIEVRTWWHYELEAIQSVYERVATEMWGPLCRSEELWRWLVGRSAHDQILLAVVPRKSSSEVELVVGYAVIRDSRILEMMTIPGYSAARSLLLARACRDAIDRDHHFVELHTPTTDPYHELLVTAGGSWVGANASQCGGEWMMKLFAPARWVERLFPLFHERACEGGVARPLAISFQVDGEGMRLLLTRRSSRLERDVQVASPDVECDWGTFQDLLISNLSFDDAMERGSLRVRCAEVTEQLAVIFPPKLLWQSPFELLRL